MRRTIFDDDHDAFRASVRGFLLKEAAPRAAEWEHAGIIDRGFWRKAAAQGFVGFSAPEELGGAGIDDFRFNVVLDEEVVKTGSLTDGFSMTNDILMPYLTELTTEEQRERWLPGVCDGSIVPALAMTEPGTGSDLRGIQSTATWRGDHYALNASKTFVTSGIQTDLVIVAAQVRREGVEGLGLFAVEAGAEGFERGRKLEKLGRKAQDTAELFFDGVRVEETNVLGEVGKGMRHLMHNLAQERLSMAVTAIANAERALEITVQYAGERHAFGKPIGSFQANRFTLAEMATEVAIGRTYVDRCVSAHVVRELTDAEAAGAKYWATELEFKVLDRCLQLHGGYGYMEEYEIARRWRDSRVQRIYGGTTEIMKEIVGRSLGF
jgi:alkylation response protein AidB-like acyl-CoA dehydrogenase